MSVDSYQYFGTADLYIGYISDFLRDGGRIGAVMPAVLRGSRSYDTGRTWHLSGTGSSAASTGPNWWRTHWDKTGKVQVDRRRHPRRRVERLAPVL